MKHNKAEKKIKNKNKNKICESLLRDKGASHLLLPSTRIPYPTPNFSDISVVRYTRDLFSLIQSPV